PHLAMHDAHTEGIVVEVARQLIAGMNHLKQKTSKRLRKGRTGLHETRLAGEDRIETPFVNPAGVRVGRHPHFGDDKRLHHLWALADMVGMSVGNDEKINPFNPDLPQARNNVAAVEPAGIDEYGNIARHQQRRITLSDVEEVDVQHVFGLRAAGRPGGEENESEEDSDTQPSGGG